MEIKRSYAWVGDKDFERKNPQFAEITAVEQDKDDIILFFRLEDNQAVKTLSLWGDNRNTLIDALSSDSDTWIGKKLRIEQVIRQHDNKKLKVLSVVKP